ncbi:MAG: MFS transporter [Pseudomonadota bacterium]
MRLAISLNPISARFALFYAAFFIGFGAYLPYMPVWYEGRGLTPELIGLAGAAAMIGRVISAPIGAVWSDRARRRRDAVVAFSFVALLVYLLHAPATHPAVLIALAFLGGASMHAITPMIDAFAMSEAARRGFAFGPPRALGSAAFIAGNVIAGWLITQLGGEAALAWVVGGAVLTAIAALALPPGRRSQDAPPAPVSWRSAGSLLSANGMALALAASAMIQCAHGFYYAFSAIAWQAQGASATLVGVLWSIGVGCEVVLLIFANRLFRGWSPAALMALGGAASVARWTALALSPPIWVLFALQGLHALTFAATYLGLLRFVQDNAPEDGVATVQAVNSALSSGVFLALATMASGLAYAAFQTAGFAFMALPSGLGLVCALLLMRRA